MPCFSLSFTVTEILLAEGILQSEDVTDLM